MSRDFYWALGWINLLWPNVPDMWAWALAEAIDDLSADQADASKILNYIADSRDCTGDNSSEMYPGSRFMDATRGLRSAIRGFEGVEGILT